MSIIKTKYYTQFISHLENSSFVCGIISTFKRENNYEKM